MRGPRERLDSWKSIADYLRRDERTVRRWEKTLGLPVHRVPGGRGHSVFAYVEEIESWLQSRPPAGPATETGVLPGAGAFPAAGALPETSALSATGALPGTEARAPLLPTRRRRPAGLALVALAAVAAAGAIWLGLPRAADGPLTVEATDTAVTAFDASGAERWRYVFPPDVRVHLATSSSPGRLPALATGVLVGVTMRQRLVDGTALGGQLLGLSPEGRLERTFELDDEVSFGGAPFGAPWALTEFSAEMRNGRPIVAVAAHHYTWWPGLVTLLDENWNRLGTFVNAGWVEHVAWLPGDRLLIAGFSNARDGGMVALLDPAAVGGQSPEPEGSAFHCDDCRGGAPARYVVLPRSELNRVTAAGFNRSALQVLPNRVLVTTSEARDPNGQVVDAIYEFSPALELRSASFSDRYWDLHRALEAQGLVDHDRSRCPERDGPPAVLLWEPGSGWSQVAAPGASASPASAGG